MNYSGIPYKEPPRFLNIPIPAFFLLLLIFQLFFMPGLMKKGGRLYVPFKRVVVGGCHNNPPYEFLDENNEPSGYNVELTQAIAAEMGLDVEVRLGRQNKMVDAFQKGEIDILQGVIEMDPVALNNRFHACTYFNQKLFARSPHPQLLSSLSQLKGGRIALSRSTPYLKRLIHTHPHLQFIEATSHSQALRCLALGQADYALLITLPSLYLNRALHILEQETGDHRITLVGELTPQMGYGYVARDPGNPFFTQMESCVSTLKTSGRQKEVQNRWLGPLSPSEEDKREKTIQLGGLIFSPLLFAACTIFFWSYSLKQEVGRRTHELAVQQQQLIQADKMTSLGILVSGVAHEINNPMGLIVHNLSFLQKLYTAAEASLEERFQEEGDFFIGGLKFSMIRQEAGEMFSEMNHGAQRIIQIVNDLKEFSSKKSPALTGQVDLTKAINASIRLLELPLKKMGCSVLLETQEPLPCFRGNRHQIEQVIVNLILNGAQAHQNPGHTVTVRAWANHPKQHLILTVCDEGQGIEKDQLPFLFDPFYTTKREQGGTGLGLSISERIVKEHKGELTVESEVGKGTTVSMHLPFFHEESHP
ncbi:MAG: transporter substrate-binding domain-containing protein [Desulfobacterales bacterium]|nr:transporter substrate-binding domain-containing protein [Desulfobacterales bacterium]